MQTAQQGCACLLFLQPCPELPTNLPRTVHTAYLPRLPFHSQIQAATSSWLFLGKGAVMKAVSREKLTGKALFTTKKISYFNYGNINWHCMDRGNLCLHPYWQFTGLQAGQSKGDWVFISATPHSAVRCHPHKSFLYSSLTALSLSCAAEFWRFPELCVHSQQTLFVWLPS